jgi:hypothetical protein
MLPPDHLYPAAVSPGERFWPARVRWRLRGAWLWPAFAVAVAGDAALLHFLPPTRTEQQIGPDALSALGNVVLSTFANLLLVGVAAPWISRRLRARAALAREAPPLEVLFDRVSVALLAAGALGLLAAGLAARPLVIAQTRDEEENAHAIRDYVLAHGDRELRENLGGANTVRLAEGYFRTCVPSARRDRAHCFFVDTHANPPTVRPDPDQRPNSEAIRR